MSSPKKAAEKPPAPAGPKIPFVASSAQRRRKRPPRPGMWAALILAVFIVLVVIFKAPRHRVPPPKAPPAATPTTPAYATPPTPPPTPAPAPTSPMAEEVSAPVVITPPPAPSPTPLPTWTPRPRSRATGAPDIARCVLVSWSARQGEAPLGQVLIDIDATNRCGRELGPLDVWFTISGWRHGSLVQTVTGHPFDTIGDGETGSSTIALPGSLDWYDRITVQVSGAQRIE
ncbi:MAG: hypothetical protein GXP48_06875 [Acidobacteria bacterium]|nr:hypothetical protein [Acidobacteriota bacterium]